MARRSSCFQCLRAAALAFAVAGPARANGAFPDEFSIHFPPDGPRRIYLGANFGLLVSEDDGSTWRYSCEPWVVSASNAALAFANVIFYQVTASGTLLADSITVTRSSDVGCTWPTSTGSVSGESVEDLFPDPNDATFVIALIVLQNASYLVASHDGGKTFDATHLLDTPDLLTGVEIARSKPGVVYATSVSITQPPGPALFYSSADSGAHWKSPPTTITVAPAGTEPRILTIDPADANKVYLRLISGLADGIAMSTDGGQSFKTVLTLDAPLSSFLRAGDGALYAGTRTGKLYVQPAGATMFSPPRPAPHLRCLGQRPGATRIYACADMVVDGYSLASSDDSGTTFQPVMSFTQLQGPLTCAPVATSCQAHWTRIQGVLGILPDAGTGSGPPRTSGGSHCGSAGAEWCGVWGVLALLMWRRRS